MASETGNKRKTGKISTKCFRQEIDLKKINKIFVKRWILDRMQEQVPDDDIAVEFVFELLMGAEGGKPNIKVIRAYTNEIIGEEESTRFCVALWQMLLDAQKSKNGIPRNLLEERMKALIPEEDSKAKSKEKDDSKVNSDAAPDSDPRVLSIMHGLDGKALKEANQILESLRPKTSSSKVNKRVEKPKRKTNYNRA